MAKSDGQAVSRAQDPRREIIRGMLSRRYNGVMDPITDEAVDAVLDELDKTEEIPVTEHDTSTLAWGPSARKENPHQFQPGDQLNPQWCDVCGWVEDAYVHASEAERRAFDAARREH